ncbi:hypothetical protein, partial [Xanthomonas citri]|uniref:hypothetical protein n=1 Tax=Xanthomonas citri TaxID=346 RepID=UPI001CA56DAC
AQALSVTERQLHGSLLNMRRVVSRICGALFRASLVRVSWFMAPADCTAYQTMANEGRRRDMFSRVVI